MNGNNMIDSDKYINYFTLNQNSFRPWNNLNLVVECNQIKVIFQVDFLNLGMV